MHAIPDRVALVKSASSGTATSLPVGGTSGFTDVGVMDAPSTLGCGSGTGVARGDGRGANAILRGCGAGVAMGDGDGSG